MRMTVRMVQAAWADKARAVRAICKNQILPDEGWLS